MEIKDGECIEEVMIKNRPGIHARPSSLIRKRCEIYPDFVYLTRQDKPGNIYDCKDTMSLMSMEAYPGDKIIVHVEGEDETARNFCRELSSLLSSNFEEAYAD